MVFDFNAPEIGHYQKSTDFAVELIFQKALKFDKIYVTPLKYELLNKKRII